ncbi:MAG: hypothetical protein AVDCRST_MAG19-1713 [uncultured Thermomicrobiales bacterium]|uniref:Glycosyltransferase RgtA/B/C/D-like domain-containing protein n=1 Tax=uncultured Thermomicrobiales bacterium TaxID=1645740 RepID=A0A6J4UW28_9BACT|nr:MAG: hypothetical protein AVDCRST_MAG19-1713 [uncultured Thermomicrobiales bacterium]
MNGTPRPIHPRFPSPVGVALVAVLLAAFGLRVFGLDWDRGLRLHPDEMYIVDHVLIGRIRLDWPPNLPQLLDPATSGLNPRSADPETGEFRQFPYGALPLLVTDAVAGVLSWLDGRPWGSADRVYLVGRTVSAILDTLTVLLVYALGARVFSRRVGLLGAAVAALAPIAIQLAHFFTTDSWLTFFVALCLYGSVRSAESGSRRWFAAAGAAFGLGMATKGSVFPLAGVLVAAAAYVAWRSLGDGIPRRRALNGSARRLALAGAVAVAAFACFEPYALLNPDIFLQSLQEQAAIVRGSFDVPFTRRYVGTVPVVYQIEQFLRWGFGPVAGLLSVAGSVMLIRRFWRERTAGQWVTLAWLLGYGLVISVAEAKFLRYLAPLVPVLAVTAGLALDAVWKTLEQRGHRRLAVAAVSVLIAGTALWSAAFESVYAQENTRLAASRWIYANVPSGSSLTYEYWDDDLPRNLGPGLTQSHRQYEIVEMDLYSAADPPAEVAGAIYGSLERADYVVLSSNRVSSAVPRSPWRYPVQTRYFELLQSGRLGFELAAEFARPPSLGPLRFVDHDADESFINYDHPRVLIFRKDGLVPRETYERLMSWAVARPWSDTRYAPERSLLLDEPVGERAVVADARWSETVTGSSVGALAAWVILLAVLQIVGWPLASLAFGRFADAGWGLARLVALVTSGYLVWLGSSTRLISFRAAWAAATLAVVGGAGWTLYRRMRRHGGPWAVRRHQRRAAVGAEVTFWVVFAIFLLFRYLNPDGWHPIWGGEKPMEFAHLNATLRSAHFPPYDPWYADGVLNYYYYGLYLVAFCFKLTGIPTEIGFNLAQPTVIALLASAGFSVAAALGRRPGQGRGYALAGGALGALMLVGVGNLGTLRLLLEGGPAVGDPFSVWTWGPSRGIGGTIITEFPFFTGLYADLHAHVVALPITVLAIALCYALASDSGVLASAVGAGRAREARIVLASRLVLLALVLGTLSATNAWDVPVYVALAVVALLTSARTLPTWPRRMAAVLGLGACLGAASYLLFLPFYAHYVALFGTLEWVRAPTPPVAAASHLGGLFAVASFGLVVALLPRRGRVGLLGEPLVPAAVASGILLVVALLLSGVAASDSDARLEAGLVAGSLGLAAVLFGVAVLGRSEGADGDAERSHALLRGGVVVAALGVGLAIASDRLVLAAFLTVGAAAIAVWLRGHGDGTRFAGLMVAAGAFVGAGTELVVLADDLIGTDWYRMNTVFKFYNQIWVLVALAGAALATTMLAEGRAPASPGAGSGWAGPSALGIVPAGRAASASLSERRTGRREIASEAARRHWSRAGLAVTGVSIAASLLYPLTATLPRLDQRFAPDLGSGTLDALEWMGYGRLPLVGNGVRDELGFAGDRAAIDWFNREVEGSPVVAEASIGTYRCNGSRISIGTGLPTIIGWERHERQQRSPDVLPGRVEDVRRLYATPDVAEKRSILDRYNVEYVVVGQLERDGIRIDARDRCAAAPTSAGIVALEGMEGTDLEVAFSEGDTTVYRVLPIVGR